MNDMNLMQQMQFTGQFRKARFDAIVVLGLTELHTKFDSIFEDDNIEAIYFIE
jgi:hypothetical protein